MKRMLAAAKDGRLPPLVGVTEGSMMKPDMKWL